MESAFSSPDAIIRSVSSRREFLALGAAGGGAVLLAACGAASPSTPAARPSGNRWGVATITIITGRMLGKEDWSAYVPSDFSVPANANVEIGIINFDHAHALDPGTSHRAEVKGTVGGTVTVYTIDTVRPNALWAEPKALSRFDPGQISHTFTIDELGLNVPVAPNARTTFTIATGAPRAFEWRCFVPCATPADPHSGSMATPGYMQGKLVVVA